MEIKKYQGRTLSGVTVENKILKNHVFEECTIDNCSFINATLKDCKFDNCKFVNCKFISTANEGSDFKECVFEKCNLLSVDWTNLFTRNGVLPSVRKMTNCCLKYVIIKRVNFGKFDFTTNDLVECTFSDCRLTGANFKGCNLKLTEFMRCDLACSDFSSAHGYLVEITSCKLKDAKFSFPEAMNLLNGLGIKIE